MPLGSLCTGKILRQHLVNKCCLNLKSKFWAFFNISRFCQNPPVTDDFGGFIFFAWWTLGFSSQIDSKMTSTWSEDTFGTPFHYKNDQLSFSPHMLPNFDFLKFPLFPRKSVFAKISIVQTILVYFSSMNFTFWFPYWLKNDFNFIGRCLWDRLSLQN